MFLTIASLSHFYFHYLIFSNIFFKYLLNILNELILFSYACKFRALGSTVELLILNITSMLNLFTIMIVELINIL